MASEDLVVRFGPVELGEILGREALKRLDIEGERRVILKAIVEKGVFQEIVVRVAPQIDAGREALAHQSPAQDGEGSP